MTAGLPGAVSLGSGAAPGSERPPGRLPSAVVGGGVAGLVAALRLARAGRQVVLLERDERLGGRIRTETRDGFVLEAGPDSFVNSAAVAALVEELGLAERVLAPRAPGGVTVWTGRRLERFPSGLAFVVPVRLGALWRSPLLSPMDSARAALDIVLPGRAPLAGQDEAIGSLLRRRFGAGYTEHVAGVLLGALYGAPVDGLSAAALTPRLLDAERRHGSLIRWARRGRAHAAPELRGFRGGTAELVAALEARLGALGVDIRRGTAVAALERGEAGFLLRLDGAGSIGAGGSDGSGGAPDAAGSPGPAERLAVADIVIGTPGPAAVRLLSGVAPAAVAPIRAIPHGSSVTVNLGFLHAGSLRGGPFDRVALPRGHGFLVAPGTDLAIGAATFASAKWPGRAPASGALVRVSMHEDVSAAGDDELIALARRDLARAIGLQAEPVVSLVARFSGAMPRYAVGHLRRIAAIDAALASEPHLALAGASYRGVGIADCVASGEAAALRLLAAAVPAG